MSDDEDYLSDKFLLAEASTTAPKTYSQLRADAQRQATLKNERNRKKSRRELEQESRQEALSKSLFTRAKEEEEGGSTNKAFSIMLKMGFSPGQTLGVQPEDRLEQSEGSSDEVKAMSHHKAEPLPLNEWEGKTGIGMQKKRARSPSSVERVAKMAKMAQDANQLDFRDRQRQMYEISRAQGKLVSAQRTCVTLDERAGKSFNVLWLDPQNPQTFPPGLIDALALHTDLDPAAQDRPFETEEMRLRKQIRSEMLSSPGDEDDATTPVVDLEDPDYADIMDEVVHFLRLQAPDRLHLLLSYLRDNYHYCFWCGTEYKSNDEMIQDCPGPDEDAHD